jgi:hypothetical protein
MGEAEESAVCGLHPDMWRHMYSRLIRANPLHLCSNVPPFRSLDLQGNRNLSVPELFTDYCHRNVTTIFVSLLTENPVVFVE